MPKFPRAAKKSLWIDLSPFDKFSALCNGYEYAKDVDAAKLALDLFSVWQDVDTSKEACAHRERTAKWVNSWPADIGLTDAPPIYSADWVRGPKSPIRIFRKVKPGSIEESSQIFIKRIMELLFDCERHKNTRCLRNLADAIDSGNKPRQGAADPQRAWLWIQLNPTARNPKKTFAEVRREFDDKFPDNDVENSQLREWITDVGGRLVRSRPGPKGPRIR